VRSTRTIDVRELGVMPYEEALALQRDLVERRRTAAVGDTLLLVEHPPVITLGARNRVSRGNVTASDDELARLGIAVVDAGRGGDVTYHGPGQLVGYPIFDLKPDRCDVHRYVRDLEEALILAIEACGVTGGRVSGRSGVWVGVPGHEEKVAAIGVRLSRWITSHGFALNVTTNCLEHFGLIVPCGISDRGVTSLERVLGRPVGMRTVADAVVSAVRQVFA
jgi:lipoyl(octanoyl) transferase